MLASLQLKHASLSNVGRKRTSNEDAYLAQPGRGVFAVADGTIDACLEGDQPERIASTLVKAALDAGGKDNVTVVVVRLVGAPLPEPEVIGSELACAALAQSALFSSLTASEVVRVQRLSQVRMIPGGAQAFVQGELQAELFVVLTGRISAWQKGQRLGMCGPGDPFGALALVAERARATYQAEVDSLALVFPLAELRRVLADDPTLAAKLAFAALALLARRLDETAETLAKQLRLGDAAQTDHPDGAT